MPPAKVYTSAEFWNFVNLPENAGRFFELIDGEIVEVMASNPAASEVGGDIFVAIKLWLKQNPIARATPADGGCDIDDENTFAPDIAVILKSRQEKFPREGFNKIPPDFVVEVVSPSDLKDPFERPTATDSEETGKISGCPDSAGLVCLPGTQRG